MFGKIEKKLFSNVGNKIKTIAKIVFRITTILYILLGALLIIGSIGSNNWFLGILLGALIIAFGILFSFLSVVTFFAFGQLVDNTDQLVENQNYQNAPPVAYPTQPQVAYPAQPQVAYPTRQQPSNPVYSSFNNYPQNGVLIRSYKLNSISDYKKRP